MVGLAGVRASCGSMPLAAAARIFGCAEEDCLRRGRQLFLFWIARNPLKSPESDEGIQINPRESKLAFLGFSWSGLDSV
jgi:hypothetical protein